VRTAPLGRLNRLSFYLIVRGPLGAGKTTVAHALARSLRAEVVPIDEILELYEWDGGSETLFLKANVVAAERARASLSRGVPVILDGNFYWDRVIDDLVDRLPYRHRVFSLRVPLEVCVARDHGRSLSYGAEAVGEVFEKAARVTRGIPLDGTREVEAVVAEVRSRLPPEWLRVAPEPS
jgi:tRNA uridine 5-carbamoylmethylation protein Kti12